MNDQAEMEAKTVPKEESANILPVRSASKEVSFPCLRCGLIGLVRVFLGRPNGWWRKGGLKPGALEAALDTGDTVKDVAHSIFVQIIIEGQNGGPGINAHHV